MAYFPSLLYCFSIFVLLLLSPQAFPRFYYVSDDSLLSILSSPSSTHSLQPHLGSLFAAVTNIIVSSPQDEETPVITAVESPEGEVLQLELPVSVGILPPSAGYPLRVFVARSVRYIASFPGSPGTRIYIATSMFAFQSVRAWERGYKIRL